MNKWASKKGSFWLEWFGSRDDPVDIFENLSLAELKKVYKKIENTGYYLVGYLSYEWGVALEGIAPANTNDELKLPLNWFGLYDLSRRSGTLVKAGTRHPLLREDPIFQSSFNKKDYLQAIYKIKDYLRAGDCYQVNLSQRFETKTEEEPWAIYSRLRDISPAPYACFLDAGHFQILSSSPELFLEAKADGTLLTKPIKGTRRRGETPPEDQTLKEDLKKNPKDNAELLMITDLERNDLGKVCIPGSVQVPQLQTIETYAQVHHLVSTVIGQRKENCNIIDVLAGMMPGGSITGAPKIRAMEIIRELEPVNRGIYTGAIGWLGPNNTACFNIAIRTIVLQNKKAYFSAGGGIVIDSKPEMEYEESLTKAEGMKKALQL